MVSTYRVGSDTFTYTYNADGRITLIKKNSVLRQSYGYYADGQLRRENDLDSNKTVLYTYDSGGNITKKTEHPYSTSGTVSAATSTVNYTYDSTWKDKLTSYNGESISYDAMGNPTSYRGATATWFGRQLRSYTKGSTSVSYKYDENGLRTQKTVNGVVHDYYYVGDRLVYEKLGDEYEYFYCYDADGRLAMVERVIISSGAKGYFFTITNAQGDVVGIRSTTGAVIARYNYDAFGKLISTTDNSGNTLPSYSFAYQISVRYRGYYYDSETGLYYLQSRYYDPETGRFLNADDVDYLGATGTQLSYNAFAYCENDVVNMADQSGKILYEAIRFMYSSPIGFLGLGFYNPNANNLRDFFNQPWSTKHYCAQKMVGYCDAYDVMAWAMGCFIHCAKSEFYYRGKWWRVELWMGRYGISVGGEIGFYNRKSQKKPTFYNCSSEGFVMSFTLYEYIQSKKTKELFRIATNEKFRNLAHWWLTGFKYNTNLTRHPPYSRNLLMKASISFNDINMARLFKKNLKTFGWTNTKIDIVSKDGVGYVKIVWSSYNATINTKFRKAA